MDVFSFILRIVLPFVVFIFLATVSVVFADSLKNLIKSDKSNVEQRKEIKKSLIISGMIIFASITIIAFFSARPNLRYDTNNFQIMDIIVNILLVIEEIFLFLIIFFLPIVIFAIFLDSLMNFIKSDKSNTEQLKKRLIISGIIISLLLIITFTFPAIALLNIFSMLFSPIVAIVFFISSLINFVKSNKSNPELRNRQKYALMISGTIFIVSIIALVLVIDLVNRSVIIHM